MSDKTSVQDGLPVPGRYWAILAIALGITVSVLDGAIANVALPTIAGDLHTSPTLSIWVVNAYQLAITISLLSLSSIGEIWGYRKVYTYGLLLFSCTSLACALADSLVTLIIARTLQGFGAAAITSVNTALIRIIYPKRFLARGMGLNALVVSVSAAAGPTIAAGILSVANWPWLFAVNIPVGLTALLLSYKFLPPNPVVVKGRRFDVPGGLLNAVTFGLLIAIIEGFTHDVNIFIILAGVLIAAFSGYVYIRREMKEDYPLFPVDLLKIPVFSLSILTSVFSFIAQMLAMVSLPFFLQRVLGKDEVATGLLLTPWPLATMLFAPLAGILSDKIKAGLLGGIGMIIFAIGLFLLATMPTHLSDTEIIWRMAVCGCGFGLFQTPNNSTIIASAPDNRGGGASGMLGTARLMGQTIGASLVALMFKVFPGHSMHASLLLGSVLAVVAAVISMLRVSNRMK
ncbi:MFS transporter [Parabacteroides bouchesdurhonensis]|uniref:MFS transporter n=1 Tax=Parabacteroides bouchesdurhonensis TaxID=1936995 RepID=UPI000E547AA1|nr:MFS transporter [Parabacteroides bouchesdurhonensis]RHJ95156.1 MFS transporter [Bacteroides sp. AM07-16]